MKEYSEEELRLLLSVLPNAARELRGAMANVYAAVNRLTPMEARERDEKLDKNAAVFTQGYYKMYRVIGNMSDAPLLADDAPVALSNDDIVGVVRGVCERASAPFALRGVNLTFTSDKSGHVIAMNAELIEKLLLNLLSNALKFTPQGGSVAVRVRVEPRSVYLSVSDTGRGIAPERLEHIFERYLETDAAAPEPAGLGLGLALCRCIAQRHGGAIVAESEEGRGAAFTVSLPNVRAKTVQLSAPRAAYTGGFNETLVGLADALPWTAFTHQYLD